MHVVQFQITAISGFQFSNICKQNIAQLHILEDAVVREYFIKKPPIQYWKQVYNWSQMWMFKNLENEETREELVLKYRFLSGIVIRLLLRNVNGRDISRALSFFNRPYTSCSEPLFPTTHFLKEAVVLELFLYPRPVAREDLAAQSIDIKKCMKSKL